MISVLYGDPQRHCWRFWRLPEFCFVKPFALEVPFCSENPPGFSFHFQTMDLQVPWPSEPTFDTELPVTDGWKLCPSLSVWVVDRHWRPFLGTHKVGWCCGKWKWKQPRNNGIIRVGFLTRKGKELYANLSKVGCSLAGCLE